MQKSNSLTIKPTTPTNLSNLNFYPLSTSVSSLTTFSFVFTTSNYLPKDAVLEIILPSDFTNLDKNIIKINGISKLNTLGYLNYELNGNKFKILNAVNQYYLKTDVHNLKISQIRNPYSTKKTGNFFMNIYDNLGGLIYSNKNELTFTASAGTFSTFSITPENLGIGLSTKYNFSLITDSYITRNSNLIIIFPSEIGINFISNSSSCNISQLDGIIKSITGITCSVSNSNKIILSNLFPNDNFSTQNKFSFTIENIKNPICVKDNFNFIFSLDSSDGNTINYFSNNFSLGFSSGNIGIIKYSFLNNFVNSLNSINLDLQLTNEISNNSKILIEIPKEFRFQDDKVEKINFSLFLFDSISNDFTKNFTNFTSKPDSLNNYIFSLEFESTKFKILPNTKLRIIINNLINPRSIKEIFLINIKTFDLSNNCLVDNLNTSLSFNIFQALINPDINFLPKENITGKLTNYILSITSKSRLISGDKIIINFPNFIQITKNTSLNGLTENITKNLDFIISNVNEFNQINIILGIFDPNKLFIFENENIQIGINNLINPSSTKTFEIPEISIFTNTGILIEKSNKINFKILNANNLNNILIKPLQSFIGGTSDYTIEFITSNMISKDSVIKIEYPEQISVIDNTCTGLTGIYLDITCSNDNTKRIILVNNAFPKEQISGLIKFKIAGLRNDLKNGKIQTDSFKISIVTNEGFLIDSTTTGLNITFLCNYPCKTCKDDTFTCLSCDSLKNLILLNGTCSEKCPDGYYYSYELDQDKNSCKKCNVKCKSCSSNNPDICISCSEANPFYLLEDNSCVNKCPDGYYVDYKNMQCQKCSVNCKTCINSPSICTSCTADLFYFDKENRCMSDCPQNISIKTVSGNIKNCLSCDRSCKTCKDKPENCLSCNTTFAFYLGKCIQEQDCPKNFIALNGVCVNCDEKCEICKDGNDLSLCLKCKEGYILGNDSKCHLPVNKCEQGYYNKEGVCYKCDSTCKNCSVDSNLCVECPNNYFLQARKCIEQCSDGYYKKNNIECGKCDSACKICGIRSDNCTRCIDNMILFVDNPISACVNSCPDGFFLKKKNVNLNGNIISTKDQQIFSDCNSCMKNCKKCGDLNACEKCDFGYFLYLNSKCLKFCPLGYYENTITGYCDIDVNISKRKSNYVNVNNLYGVINNNFMCKCDYTFTFLIIFFIGFFVILYLKFINGEIHLCGSLLGFSSLFTFSLNIYLLKIIFNFGINYLFYLMMIKFFFNFTINNVFVFIFSISIRNKDSQFSYWAKNNQFYLFFYIIMGLIIDFKTIRLLYSKFRFFKLSTNNKIINFLSNFFNSNFCDLENISKPFKKMLIVDIILSDILMFIISLLVFFNFSFSIEILKVVSSTFIIYLVLLIVKIIELISFKNDDEFYNQRKITAVDIKPHLKNSRESNEDKDIKIQIKDNQEDFNNRNKNNFYENNFTENNKNPNRFLKTNNSYCYNNDNLCGLQLNKYLYNNSPNNNRKDFDLNLNQENEYIEDYRKCKSQNTKKVESEFTLENDNYPSKENLNYKHFNNRIHKINNNFVHSFSNKIKKDNYTSNNYEINEEKKVNTIKTSNSNNLKNKIEKIGFLKKITDSIKNIFPSTKKTKKDYYVVEEENQVSCFNKKINYFKGDIRFNEKFSDITSEYKKNPRDQNFNVGTPNFNSNNYNEVKKNVWAFNDSISYRNNDLSDINLVNDKNHP